MKFLRIGYGNAVVASRIQQIKELNSAEGKRWKKEADSAGKLIDATAGRQTRSLLITDSGYIVLSSLTADSLRKRWGQLLTKE